MLKLYYSPGACSMSCHVALAESGLEYEIEEINTAARANFAPGYLVVNPLGKVPALAVEGSILTEAAAILGYIADLVPEKKLLPPPGSFARAQAHEWFGFLSSSVHIAFRSVFRPERVGGDDKSASEAVRAQGRKLVSDALLEVERRLKGKRYCLGDAFSLCDAYALVYFRWSLRDTVFPYIPPLPELNALAEKLIERSSVKAVFSRESISL